MTTYIIKKTFNLAFIDKLFKDKLVQVFIIEFQIKTLLMYAILFYTQNTFRLNKKSQKHFLKIK